jgi:hypothetical protein
MAVTLALFGIQHDKLVSVDGIDQVYLTNLVAKYETSLGRVRLLKHAVCKLSPTSVLECSDTTVAVQFRELVVSGEIHGGAITGLTQHGFTNRNGELQQRGIDLLREIASGYQRVEA